MNLKTLYVVTLIVDTLLNLGLVKRTKTTRVLNSLKHLALFGKCWD